ncbi:hypothetical protein K3163_05475 [Qipengyuania sp. 1NDW9]|uniref:hypothetical protein n=1 Tax=Qipengyuania xiapuensis TaxID=2867236 RepID=UPI001C86CA8E|nr:hypothetical protein [Qipengyuania xiapuensis]MBX7492652.1 hypothetical protein [Qipengyuania xiapuensis]
MNQPTIRQDVLAKLLHVAPASLTRMASDGRFPACVSTSADGVREFDLGEVREWLDSRLRSSPKPKRLAKLLLEIDRAAVPVDTS